MLNIFPSALVHFFPHPTPFNPSSITTIVQTPAVDVVGIGYLDGSIRIQDIKHGDLVMQMKIEDGAVSSMSFRMGNPFFCMSLLFTNFFSLDGPSILATASSTGSISIWDLSKGGRILHTLRGAHDQSISGLQWVSGQPLLVSSSLDNSVKVRIQSRLVFVFHILIASLVAMAL